MLYGHGQVMNYERFLKGVAFQTKKNNTRWYIYEDGILKRNKICFKFKNTGYCCEDTSLCHYVHCKNQDEFDHLNDN